MWTSKTEFDSKSRPKDSLLNLKTDFKSYKKEIKIEDNEIDQLVKQRIRDKMFDNHELKNENFVEDYELEGEVEDLNLYELYDEICNDLDKISVIYKPYTVVFDKEIKKPKPKKKINERKKALNLLKKYSNVEIKK